jgi:hypothetical protein
MIQLIITRKRTPLDVSASGCNSPGNDKGNGRNKPRTSVSEIRETPRYNVQRESVIHIVERFPGG